MKIKVHRLMDATVALANIINAKRPMPQVGKFRLARLHAKLTTEFDIANQQRNEMIIAYGVRRDDGDGYGVPKDKIEEFTAAWQKIADQEVSIEVDPIPLAAFDLGAGVDGAIEAAELLALGELVTE
jgi:hypothetical protein